MQNHFSTHKQKYISFLVVALFVVMVTYAGKRTEASEPFLPSQEALMMQQLSGRRCPPHFLHLMDIIHFAHPCMLDFFNAPFTPPVPSEPAPSVDIPLVSPNGDAGAPTASSTATTTDATTTDATSTNATTTEATSTTTGTTTNTL